MSDVDSTSVVKEVKIGPFKGYYGRAVWQDATERFEGWIICKDRIKFHSTKEKNIKLNFQRAVAKMLGAE